MFSLKLLFNAFWLCIFCLYFCLFLVKPVLDELAEANADKLTVVSVDVNKFMTDRMVMGHASMLPTVQIYFEGEMKLELKGLEGCKTVVDEVQQYIN